MNITAVSDKYKNMLSADTQALVKGNLPGAAARMVFGAVSTPAIESSFAKRFLGS